MGRPVAVLRKLTTDLDCGDRAALIKVAIASSWQTIY
jgi:hypothetical protein